MASKEFDGFGPSDLFVERHIGPDEREVEQMLETIGAASLDALIDQTVPKDIRLKQPLRLGPARGEHELINELRSIAKQNTVNRSFIGMGYYGTITPPVIQRNILENPGWYTQYTPYQAEIAQGRLEALLNFQTMVSDLTALPIANASLLDEATAAAEAMGMCFSAARQKKNKFFVAHNCHPQTIEVVQTRATPLGIEIVEGDPEKAAFDTGDFCGLLLQNPDTNGVIHDYDNLIEAAKSAGVLVVVATDLLALTLIKPPGEMGADIAVGSAQRFGVPMGFGGPHAAFISCTDELKRLLPGRLVGVSKDAQGNTAYRLAIQTREQHIKRDKATSNICTAQVLLAIMASMYAVYHGPEGLRVIARRVHALAEMLANGLAKAGAKISGEYFFDTIQVGFSCKVQDAIRAKADAANLNFRYFANGDIGISLDETSTIKDVRKIWSIVADATGKGWAKSEDIVEATCDFDFGPSRRGSDFLTHPVFNTHHSETEMLRYMYKLQQRDLSLATSMIPLGSCTMKLNGTSEMLPITWPEFAHLHPFAPREQAAGYRQLFLDLNHWLAEITGFAAISLQPNAGAQGEYAGLLVIRAYHESRNDKDRNVCLIPVSAHGTNPASAIMAGFDVVPIACDDAGNIDVADLRAKAAQHSDKLGALMITYPSTHGVFETSVREVCDITHQHGGQVYMDGANMNAQVGLTRPADMGADVCHLNLHKTFCIPHGGGGPGMGPIGVAAHLTPFLPGHSVVSPFEGWPDTARMEFAAATGNNKITTHKLGASATGAISAAPFGSAAILPIPWVYIALMGGEGLKRATQVAILNANYMAARLKGHYDVLYVGKNGRVAHEFILDLRAFKKSADINPEDIAKRLIDYGYHAPTMSWPVAGTLMIEPTESEAKGELDRFCDAMIAIRNEIRQIEAGALPRDDNPLKNAPHTASVVATDDWSHPYTREQAAFPLPYVRESKFWPAVGRIDNVWGDRNLFCSCPPIETAQASQIQQAEASIQSVSEPRQKVRA